MPPGRGDSHRWGSGEGGSNPAGFPLEEIPAFACLFLFSVCFLLLSCLSSSRALVTNSCSPEFSDLGILCLQTFPENVPSSRENRVCNVDSRNNNNNKMGSEITT